MSPDPKPVAADSENLARPASAPVRYSVARHANHVDESPDLLRWRADLLMDEMMLGGVDVSAADNAPSRPAQSEGSRYDPGYESGSVVEFNGENERWAETQPARDRPVAYVEADEPRSRSSVPPEAAAGGTTGYDAGPSAPASANRGSTLGDSPANGRASQRPSSDAQDEMGQSNHGAVRNAYVNRGYGTGEAGRGNEQSEESDLPRVRRREPTSYLQERSEAAPPRSQPARASNPAVDAHTEWAHSPEKWEWQDFGARDAEPDDDIPAPFTEYRPQDRQIDAAVRRDPADFVGAMSVVGGGRRRSTLLPRMSNMDPDTLNREIGELHEEIAKLLPLGHETAERARHLLDKAYSILQSDPLRSAEVEYYMQQVRTIVQRLRQTRSWSDIYRDRLRVYLLGWLALSAIALAARYIFHLQLVAALAVMANLGSESLMLRHGPAFFGAVAAGALGGSMGALYTMRQHARTGDSFFDRKYGLRGLMLPIIGVTVGALGYFLFGGAYLLADVNPLTSLVAGAIPALAAFAFGFSQESIYGTRG